MHAAKPNTTHSTHDLKICCLNVGGKLLERLSVKTGPHRRFFEKETPDVFAFVEVQSLKVKKVPHIPQYSRFFLGGNPTGGRPSGGLCVYVKNNLKNKFTLVKKRRADSVAWFRARRAGPDLFVCFLYCRVDNKSSVSTFYENLSSDVLEFSGRGEVLLMGDYNARLGDFVGDRVTNAQEPHFMGFLEFHDLVLLNKTHAFGENTLHYVKENHCSIIDFALTSNTDSIQTFRVDKTVMGGTRHSAHKAIVCTVRGQLQNTPPHSPPRRRTKTPFNHINEKNVEKYSLSLIEELKKKSGLN